MHWGFYPLQPWNFFSEESHALIAIARNAKEKKNESTINCDDNNPSSARGGNDIITPIGIANVRSERIGS